MNEELRAEITGQCERRLGYSLPTMRFDFRQSSDIGEVSTMRLLQRLFTASLKQDDLSRHPVTMECQLHFQASVFGNLAIRVLEYFEVCELSATTIVVN